MRRPSGADGSASGPPAHGGPLVGPRRRRHPRPRGTTLNAFSLDVASALPGPEWLRRRRAEAWDDLRAMPLPSEKEEVWRYTPIDSLSLDDYRPAPAPAPGLEDPLAGAFSAGVRRDLGIAGAVLEDRDGWPSGPRGGGSSGPPEGLVGQVLTGGDALVRLNDAFHPAVTVVDVPRGEVVEEPIVVVHWCSGAPLDGGGAPAVLPRTVVRLGEGARAAVVEVVAGAVAGRSLIVPVTELAVGDAAHLSYVSFQVLGPDAWHIGRLAATVGRDATLRTFTAGLGGAYDRSRVDAVAAGPGAATELRSVYLGTGDQVHDVRTMQDHAAPHTTSDLLCKGAVAGSSRSVYSGLIRVRRGAARTQAFQTNNNLVLDRTAHADSVPNLDIEENDVRCSHASTVGPVDEDQRYYLESRGIPPERAERLIVLGFFEDVISRAPVPAAVTRLRQEVGIRLAGALGLDQPVAGAQAASHA